MTERAATFKDRYIPKVINDLIAERMRQIAEKGWTASHDDGHVYGELALAAALYALPYEAEIGGERLLQQDDFIALHMALEIACGWKINPEPDQRRRLVKAAALIVAEIERLDRQSAAEAA